MLKDYVSLCPPRGSMDVYSEYLRGHIVQDVLLAIKCDLDSFGHISLQTQCVNYRMLKDYISPCPPRGSIEVYSEYLRGHIVQDVHLAIKCDLDSFGHISLQTQCVNYRMLRLYFSLFALWLHKSLF